MSQTVTLDRRVTYAFLLAIALEAVAALLWAGGAAERLAALERTTLANRANQERLARVETRLDGMAKQLDRIEARLEDQP